MRRGASVHFLHVFGLFFLLGILGSGSLLAQMTYPKRTPIRFEKYAEYEEENSIFILSRIIPLGFSHDGKFAYIIEPADEACGCYFFELHIQDLNSDKKLYQKRFMYEEVTSQKWYQAWNDHGEFLIKKIQAHDIVLTAPKAQKLPIQTDSGTLQLRLDLEKKPDENMPNGEVVNLARVWLASDQLGEKRIASLRFPNNYVLGYEQGCYIKSPFEDRVAIVVLREDRGWEGPPNTINPVVIGALLKTRFQ